MKDTCELERDRIRGCMVGGAVGDALGYPVEFMHEMTIRAKFGADGIHAYSVREGEQKAVISDDTQMALFTANGILIARARAALSGDERPLPQFVAMAYQDWLRTQSLSFEDGRQSGICSYISEKGFAWGMTTNGTLIDESCVQKMAQAKMKTVSVSLDGLEKTHEELRGVKGSFNQAIKGIRLLKESGCFHVVQAVTVVSKLNIHELPVLYDLMCRLGVDSWKLTAIEPMGTARSHTELFLSGHEHYNLLNFITQQRRKGPFEITYGCSHCLPKRYDTAVRKQPFLCGAGTMIASIASNGDILPCLDIDSRDIVKQGNILHDDFIDVWENRFMIFRRNKANSSSICRDCAKKQICHGGSWHSWDFKNEKPLICFEKQLF